MIGEELNVREGREEEDSSVVAVCPQPGFAPRITVTDQESMSR